MIYAMSDIHGQYEQFLTLLEQIGIRKEDTLYILGDVVDRGPEPMKILKYMMAHSNIIPIIGNRSTHTEKKLLMGRNIGWCMPDWIIFQKQNIWKNIL